MATFKINKYDVFPKVNEKGEVTSTIVNLTSEEPYNRLTVILSGDYTKNELDQEFVKLCLKAWHKEYFADFEVTETTKKVDELDKKTKSLEELVNKAENIYKELTKQLNEQKLNQDRIVKELLINNKDIKEENKQVLLDVIADIKPNMVYKAGDIVRFKGDLYIVNNEVKTDTNPDPSKDTINYGKYKS